MVQAGTSIGYDDGMKDGRQPDQAGSAAARDAVRDCLASIVASTKQLASAAERVAAESLRVLDEVASRAQQSIHTSSAMTAAASQAATQARRIAGAIRKATSKAGERTQSEARQALEEVVARAEWAYHSAERLKSEGVQESLRRSEDLAAGSRKAASLAPRAGDEARAYADRAQESTQPINTGSAQILERLDADCQLLTRLVQELRERTIGVASPAGTTAPTHDNEPATLLEALPAWHETPIAVETGDSSPVTPNYVPLEPERPPLPAMAPRRPAFEASVPARREPGLLDGRVLVFVSPVPDFDLLLSLDGALGRMPGIRNVTLDDYAKEQVVFRVELAVPFAANDLAQRLADAVGQNIDVISAAGDRITLRLVT